MRVVTLAAAVAAAAAAPQITPESFVETPLGPVQGVVLDNARVFMSLPYAMPPVGSLRWQPPQPAPAWGPTVWQGMYDPPGCIQECDASDQPPHVCPGATSENCLFLNVWTPRLANLTAPAPVTVFIHGGAFKDGYAGGLYDGIVYDSSDWVNTTGTIVVTINYRLGALGFLYQGGSTSLQGNYGLMDQTMALQWVKANIAAFGGDPTRISVAGQSAGAMSIASHLSRPAEFDDHVYTSAILHSEPFGLPFRDTSTGQDLSNAFALNANCSDGSASANWTAVEECLRALNSTQILAVQTATQKDIAADWRRILDLFVPWTPTSGTDYLPLTPLAAFQSGAVVDVPIVFGTTSNESNLFIYFGFGNNVSLVEYSLAMDLIFGIDHGTDIQLRYPTPSPTPQDFRPHMSAIATDALFHCAIRNATASLASTAGRTSPVYLFEFTHVESFNPAAWGPVYPFVECWDIVCHGADLVELFHPNYPAYGTNYTAAETLLSASIQQYWANVAATGAPGTGSALAPLYWPAFNASGRTAMILDVGGLALQPGWQDDACSFWDNTVGYDWY